MKNMEIMLILHFEEGKINKTKKNDGGSKELISSVFTQKRPSSHLHLSIDGIIKHN